MKIAAISQPLERKTLEQIKEKADSDQREAIHAVGGLICLPPELLYYDYSEWVKRASLIRKPNQQNQKES